MLRSITSQRPSTLKSLLWHVENVVPEVLKGILIIIVAGVVVFIYGLFYFLQLESSARLYKSELDRQEFVAEDKLLRNFWSAQLEAQVVRLHQANFYVETHEQLIEVNRVLDYVYYEALKFPGAPARLYDGVDSYDLRVRNRIATDYRKAREGYEGFHFFVKWIPFIPTAEDVVERALSYFKDLRRQPR